MKKIVFLLTVVLFANFSFAQKRKTAVKKVATEKSSSAKVDNLTAEIKGKTFQVTINEKGKPVDAINVKELTDNNKPIDIKLSSFTANGTKLYLLQWTEKTNTKTDLKTEDITTVYSVVHEITNKKQVFSNFEKTNNIVEKVFLDKLKNASETQEKIRREGFVFTLNPDGSITQKNKTQENKWVYDAVKIDYVDAKKK
ncbi:hypothetical protein [Flavobacterium capsici]|uniref:Uncharacterized protein n=1 Tax=Flavobacterium capsici TaxID=3075618 RepID=A0AA96EVB5_9FLAO|nr:MULTISPECIES: hypothetical protein [unclassified Flavobacterium]WNM18906.1 hypothetical protein RN608_12945 [Flavobacterium sp. PMR2A8]WNM22956.1 hypothetical protein RN605_06245 [Flavobacterium sp. PMTSA4]